jgi:hypothetical protein
LGHDCLHYPDAGGPEELVWRMRMKNNPAKPEN